MQKDRPAFRSAVGGYNKQDVNEYIASLSDDFAKERAEYEKKLDELSKEIDSLRADKDAASAMPAFPDASVELDLANSLIAEQQQTLEKRTAELEALKAEHDGCIEKINSLEAELERFKGSEEKLSEYDRMSKKMGELLLKAASSAEKIKAEAEVEAAEILSSSREKSRELTSRANELSSTLDEHYSKAVAAINRKLTELVNDGFDTLNSSMKSADEELCTLLDRRRSAAKAAVLRTAESLPELEALARLGESSNESPSVKS